MGGVARADVPAGFQDATIASGLSVPIALTFSPDGRLFVVEQGGQLRIVKDGALLPDPFLDVTQVVEPGVTFDDSSARGLLGVAFDPNFAVNSFVYIYYSVCKAQGTSPCAVEVNRVARFTAGYQGNADVADPTSQFVLLDDIDSDVGTHNGGWIGFSPLDGKLYVAIGDGGIFPNTKAQDIGSLNGKILRLNADGTVPEDNPFFTVSGARAEIYALGFRNPWRCRFHTSDGKLFCDDVGQSTWEEVDVVEAGGNYGWPMTEGEFDATAFPPDFVEPITTYGHDNPGGNAITGGEFGSETNFPGDYQQSYFFGDYLAGFIRRVVLADDGVTVAQPATDFATNLQGNTDLTVGPDGALYYPSITAGEVHRISTTSLDQPPIAHATATPAEGPAPLDVQFSSAGSLHVPEHTIWLDSAVPLVIDGEDPNAVELGVKFTSDVAGIVTGIRFYKSAGNIGPHLGNLWDSTGTLLATATFTDESDSGWQQVTFSTPVPIAANTVYVASYFAPNGHYSSEQDFATQGVDAPPLHAPMDGGIAGHNGVFAYGQTSSFPTDSYQSNNYFVDVIFEVDGDALAFTWDFGDGSPVSTDQAPQHSYGMPGTYTVELTVNDSQGSDSVRLPVTVSEVTTTTTTTSTTTSTSTTTTSTAPSTTTTSSTAPTTSSTTTSTSSTTTQPAPSTTSTTTNPSTTSTTAPSTTSSTTVPTTSTTTTTLPPGCDPAVTMNAVLCRIGVLDSRVAGVTSDLGSLAGGIGSRVGRAQDDVERSAAFCEAGKLSRARATLRSARHRLVNAVAKIRSRSGRKQISPAVAAELTQLVQARAADLQALRDGLTCP
jgi:glucose/arabinose dehydrogenase